MSDVYPVIEESTRRGKAWIHHCATVLQGAEVIHPIYDGPHAVAGGGQVVTELVPYCPKCQSKPSSIGSPVR